MSTLEFNALLVANRQFLKGFAIGFTRDSQDAEDLIQDTMVKALRYQNNFKEGTNIKGWLYTIMRNIFINNYKRKKFQNTILDTTDNQFYLNSGSMQSDTVTTVINEQDIRGAIDDLKPNSRCHSLCSWRDFTTMKSPRNWASRWARSRAASSTRVASLVRS